MTLLALAPGRLASDHLESPTHDGELRGQSSDAHAQAFRPLVSVIIPTLDDSGHLADCIESIESSTYSSESVEVVVVDGGSHDNFQEVIRRLTIKYPNVKVIEDRGSSISKARNTAILASSGEYILNLSAHCYVERSCIEILVTKLQQAPLSVAGVGCADYIPPEQRANVPRAFDCVLRSRLGGGSAYQQFVSDKDCFFDSISFTLYRRSVFSSVGYFDLAISEADDSEFNMRLKEAGFKLIFTPETRVYRYRRERRKQVLAQLFRYGVGRGKTLKEHFTSSKKIYLVPLLAMLGLFAIVGAALFSWLSGNPSSWAFLGVPAVAYLVVIALASLRIAGVTDLRLAANVAFGFVSVHFMIAMGELVGVL